MNGLFITLEGGEGAGKTTQIMALAQALEKEGHQVVKTREPGGTPEAEKIRDLLVTRDARAWTPIAESLMLFAARAMHVESLIKPALAAGKIVICDRFTDSTRAYQGYGHGMDLKIINQLVALTLDGFEPDLTFILDLLPEEGLRRAAGRKTKGKKTEDRFEKLDLAFHQKLRLGFQEIAHQNPERCVIVDGLEKQDSLTQKMLGIIKERLKV